MDQTASSPIPATKRVVDGVAALCVEAPNDFDDLSAAVAETKTYFANVIVSCYHGNARPSANSDFGEVNETLVTNSIHDWIGRNAPPPKAQPSAFEYTDDERALRAYPLIAPPFDWQQ